MSPPYRYLTTFGNQAITAAFRQVLDHFQPDFVHVQHMLGLPVTFFQVLQQQHIHYLVTLWDYWWICANANLLTNHSHTNCAGPYAYLNCTRCVVARTGQPAAWLIAPAILGSLAWRGQLLRQILNQASQIIAPSNFVQEWYTAHGITANKMRVLGSGIEAPPANFSSQPRTDARPLRLLYLGGIAPLKGVHILLQALAQVMGKVELWIAGNITVDPSYTTHLQQLATPQTLFLGPLNRTQIWDTLARVDAVLVPSLSYETYCFVAREAFAAGVPVLAANIGALSEVVTNNINGLLLPPGDVVAWQAALQRCVDQPELLLKFRQNIPKQITVGQHVDEIQAIYDQIWGNYNMSLNK